MKNSHEHKYTVIAMNCHKKDHVAGEYPIPLGITIQLHNVVYFMIEKTSGIRNNIQNKRRKTTNK